MTKKKEKIIILDDNILSLSCYAEEFPEHFEQMCNDLDKEDKRKKEKLGVEK